MAAKVFKSLTFVLLIALAVAPWTAGVDVSPAYATCPSGGGGGGGSGGGASGDPDVPKDTLPTPSGASSLSGNPAGYGTERPNDDPRNARLLRWVLVQQFVSTLLGRHGQLR